MASSQSPISSSNSSLRRKSEDGTTHAPIVDGRFEIKIEKSALHQEVEKEDVEQDAAGGRLTLIQSAVQKITSRSAGDNKPPPDGGVQAWTIVLFAHLTGFCTWGLANSFGILQTHYVTALGRPQSDISWIGSIQSFLLFGLSIFSGRATDSGYFHQTYALGTILLLLGIFMASISTTYWQIFLSNGLCCGLGGGLTFCPALSVCGTYFKKKQSLVLGICACASSLGGLVFGSILQQLLPKIGFAWSMRVVGFVMMAIMVPANIFLEPRKLVKNLGPMVDPAAFREPAYLFFIIGMFLVSMGLFFPYYYIGSFGRNVIGISNSQANTLIMIINGAGVAGRMIPLMAVHFCGPLNLLIPLTIFTSACALAWAGVTTSRGLVIFDIFFGIVMSAGQGMFPPSLGSLTTDMSKMGVRNGMCFSIIAFACLIGPPIGGALIQLRDGSYLYAQIFVGLSLLVGAGFVTASRVHKAGWKLSARA